MLRNRAVLAACITCLPRRIPHFFPSFARRRRRAVACPRTVQPAVDSVDALARAHGPGERGRAILCNSTDQNVHVHGRLIPRRSLARYQMAIAPRDDQGRTKVWVQVRWRHRKGYTSALTSTFDARFSPNFTLNIAGRRCGKQWQRRRH